MKRNSSIKKQTRKRQQRQKNKTYKRSHSVIGGTRDDLLNILKNRKTELIKLSKDEQIAYLKAKLNAGVDVGKTTVSYLSKLSGASAAIGSFIKSKMEPKPLSTTIEGIVMPDLDSVNDNNPRLSRTYLRVKNDNSLSNTMHDVDSTLSHIVASYHGLKVPKDQTYKFKQVIVNNDTVNRYKERMREETEKPSNKSVDVSGNLRK